MGICLCICRWMLCTYSCIKDIGQGRVAAPAASSIRLRRWCFHCGLLYLHPSPPNRWLSPCRVAASTQFDGNPLSSELKCRSRSGTSQQQQQCCKRLLGRETGFPVLGSDGTEVERESGGEKKSFRERETELETE